MYAAYGTRDRGIPQDSQALISGFLRIRPNGDFLRVHQWVAFIRSSNNSPGIAIRVQRMKNDHQPIWVAR